MRTNESPLRGSVRSLCAITKANSEFAPRYRKTRAAWAHARVSRRAVDDRANASLARSAFRSRKDRGFWAGVANGDSGGLRWNIGSSHRSWLENRALFVGVLHFVIAATVTVARLDQQARRARRDRLDRTGVARSRPWRAPLSRLWRQSRETPRAPVEGIGSKHRPSGDRRRFVRPIRSSVSRSPSAALPAKTSRSAR